MKLFSNRFPPECGTTHQNQTINLKLVCAKTRYHDGGHMTRRGTTWTEPVPPAAPVRSDTAEPHECGILITWKDTEENLMVKDQCHRLTGHPGDHNPYAD